MDPKYHAFGYGEKRIPNGAALSIHSERYDVAFPKTIIVEKTVEDVKSTQ